MLRKALSSASGNVAWAATTEVLRSYIRTEQPMCESIS